MKGGAYARRDVVRCPVQRDRRRASMKGGAYARRDPVPRARRDDAHGASMKGGAYARRDRGGAPVVLSVHLRASMKGGAYARRDVSGDRAGCAGALASMKGGAYARRDRPSRWISRTGRPCLDEGRRVRAPRSRSTCRADSARSGLDEGRRVRAPRFVQVQPILVRVAASMKGGAYARRDVERDGHIPL